MTTNTFLSMNTALIIKMMTLLYVMNKNHTLTNLLIIEFISTVAAAAAIKMLSTMNMEMYMTLFVLIILITESILGLSLLINTIRTHSNDYLKSSTAMMF